jgi:hypothetical protein
LTGQTADALTHLRRAVELVPTTRDYARQDPDFDALKDDPDFQALIAGE